MIEKLTDLEVDGIYYISSDPVMRFTKRYRLIEINLNQSTIVLEHLEISKLGSISVYDISDVGIGVNMRDAINSFGKIREV